MSPGFYWLDVMLEHMCQVSLLYITCNDPKISNIPTMVEVSQQADT